MAAVKKAIFTLTGDNEGKDLILLDRYQFVKGQMHTTISDGKLIERILCTFYGVKVEYIDEDEAESTDTEASLKVQDTKPASTETAPAASTDAKPAAPASTEAKAESKAAK